MASNNSWGNILPNAVLTIGNQANSTAPAEVDTFKNRGAAGTTVQNGDGIFTHFMYADDSNANLEVGAIKLVSNGAVVVGSVPCDMSFWTFGATPAADTQRMIIASTGAVTINAPDGAAVGLTIAGGGLAVTGGTSFGALTITGALVQTGGNVTINDDASAATLKFGTGAAAKTVTIGSATTTSALLLQSGTGDVNVQSTDDINIGANAVANDITIGNVTALTTLALKTNASFSLDGVAATTYSIGVSTTTGNIVIGGTSQTGILTVGSSSGTSTVAIASGAGDSTVAIANGTAGANAVTIANGANVAAQSVSIANGATAANMTVSILSAGAGVLALGSNARVTTVGIANVAPAAARVTTVNGGDSAQNDTVSILNGNPSAGTQTVNILSGVATGGTQVLNLAAGASAKAVNWWHWSANRHS